MRKGRRATGEELRRWRAEGRIGEVLAELAEERADADALRAAWPR